MSGKAFFDTNIFIYLYADSEREKQRIRACSHYPKCQDFERILCQARQKFAGISRYFKNF